MTSRSTQSGSLVGFRLRRGGRLEGGRTSGIARCIAVRWGRHSVRTRARLARVEAGEEAFQIAAAAAAAAAVVAVVAGGTVKVVAPVVEVQVVGYSQ